LDGVQNWGFSMPLPDRIPSDGFSFEMIGGAGKCVLSKGRCDGSVTMFQESNGSFRFEVSGNSRNSVTFNGVHVYVGEEPLPKRGKKYSNAPGQFPCKAEMGGKSAFTLRCAALKTGVDANWLAFHAESSGATTSDGQAQCSFG
jgi:hypothetical protein